MGTFRDFFNHSESAELLIEQFNTIATSGQAVAQPLQNAQKPWSAKKSEILQLWKNMRADTPIIMSPISDAPPGSSNHSTYSEDGLRITGSWQFISSVLSRLKEIMAYESPQTKLRMIFRAVDRSKSVDPNKQSYVFYVNLEKRAHGQPGRPHGNVPSLP